MHRATQGGRQAGLLLLAAGAFTVVNNYLPGAEYLDIAKLNLVGAVAMALGVACWYLPWSRLPPRSTLAIAPVAFALIALGDYWGNVSPYSYAVYHVVVFVWIGLSQRPGTSLLLVPMATIAYVIPLLLDGATRGVSSAPVAIPVCVLVGETIARNVGRLDAARLALLERAELGERLAAVVADVNTELDADRVLQRICDGVRELCGAPASGFVTSIDGVATVRAQSGLPRDFVGRTFPGDEGAIAQMLQSRTTIVAEFEALPRTAQLSSEVADAVPGLHTVVAVPTIGGGEVRGALYAVFGEADGRPSQATIDVLELLAGHVGAALRNAETHTELRRQQAHEQAVVAATADGMAVIDSDGLVTSWNPAAEQLTGVTRSEALGQPIPLPLGLPGELVDHRLEDGRWVEVLASPLPTGEHVVTFRDVSKPKALEHAKDLFLATTSHELRTPLTVIKGFTSTLRDRWEDLSPQVRGEALEAVSDRTDALIRLVDHLLLSARANAEQQSVRRVPVDLGPLLQRAVLSFSAISEDHPVLLDMAPDLPLVLADETALDQALSQLLENAIKYSPTGGAVEITAELRAGRVVIGVSDRGVGLPPGAEAAVFERFHQAHGGDRRAFGGVGLGLHIVQTLAESIGATASAHRRDGGGATFEISLAAVLPAPRENVGTQGNVGAPSR